MLVDELADPLEIGAGEDEFPGGRGCRRRQVEQGALGIGHG